MKNLFQNNSPRQSSQAINKFYKLFRPVPLFFILLFLLLLLSTNNNYAQYPLAPEVWSIPEKVDIISEWAVRSESPSISWHKQKLYFDAGGIAVTEWSDTGWNKPYGLNSNINQNLAMWTGIAPNGKRIFFSWFLGGWDLYYSDWDTTANDWGIAINCGPNVNTPAEAEFIGSMPNDTTLIFLRNTVAHISLWNSQSGSWGPASRWPTPDLYFTSDLGIFITPLRDKVYLEGQRSDTTINGDPYLNYDIIVNYRDTTNPMGYKPPNILNFCLYADTQYFKGNYVDRLEGFPTLTPDGKIMYFTATYDGQTTIYRSILLIDENGNPVSVENYGDGVIPKSIKLFPAFPNPFNSETTISYTIPEQTDVKIVVYDILGQNITTLLNEVKTAGNHSIIFNTEKLNLNSGAYIIALNALSTFHARKVLLIK